MKHYIIANKKQELDVLKELEEKGLNWSGGNAKPTEWLPSEEGFLGDDKFPYILHEQEYLLWGNIKELEDEIIVYDGRKEEKMYKVTKEFMDELAEWRDEQEVNAETGDLYAFLGGSNINKFTNAIESWWTDIDDPIENNNRLIAIIQWLNGEDVFEVEEPHKFVVRSDSADKEGYYTYVLLKEMLTSATYVREGATKFDTYEEALEWANSHQVVVEIDEDGKEV